MCRVWCRNFDILSDRLLQFSYICGFQILRSDINRTLREAFVCWSVTDTDSCALLF